MKKFFMKDSVLKIVSFVIAILLWFYVIIVVDPSVDISVEDIPIRFSNRTMLEERDLTVVGVDAEFLELEIKGSRKKIANIDNENVYATVDLSNITEKGQFSLPVSVSIPYEYEEITDKWPYNVNIVIDEVVTIEKVISLRTEGKVEEGYTPGKAKLLYDRVELTGASSVVESIAEVEVTLDYNDSSDEINVNEPLYFKDTKGNIVSLDNSLYNDVKMSFKSVPINCPVLKVKTVPVRLDFADDEKQYRASVTPVNVTFFADAKIAEEIEEIATEPIVVANSSEKQDLDVHLIVPEGVEMSDGNVVKVHVERRY